MNIADFITKHNLDGRNWTEAEVTLFNEFLYTCRLDDHAEATDKCFIVVNPQTWTHDKVNYRIATPIEAMLRPDVSNTLSCHSNINSNGSARGGNLGYVSNPYWVTIYASSAGTKKNATIAHGHSKVLTNYLGSLPNPIATWNVLFTEDDNDNLVIYVSRAYGDTSANTTAKLVNALVAKYPQAQITMRQHESDLLRGGNFYRVNSRPTVYGIPVDNQLMKAKSTKAGYLFYRYADIEQPISSAPLVECLPANQLVPFASTAKVKGLAFSQPMEATRVFGIITQTNPITPRRRKTECPVCKKMGEIDIYDVTYFNRTGGGNTSQNPTNCKMEVKSTQVSCCEACANTNYIKIGETHFMRDAMPTEKVYKINNVFVDFTAKKVVSATNLVKQEDDSYVIGKVYHYPLDVPKEDGMDFASEDFILQTTTFHTIGDETGLKYNKDGSDAFVHPQYRIVASGKWICDNFPGSYKGHFDVKTDDGRWAAVDCQVDSPGKWFVDLLEYVAHNPTNTREEFIEVAERFKAQSGDTNVTTPVKKVKRNKIKKEQELALV